MPRGDNPRSQPRIRPNQLTRADTLERLHDALAQIEAGAVAFPKGGKRAAVARIREKIAALEARGVRIPSYRVESDDEKRAKRSAARARRRMEAAA